MTTTSPTALCLDSASIITGYAHLEIATQKLLGQGLLKAKPASARADDRVRSILSDLPDLIRETKPSVILCEMVVDKQYTRDHKKASGLPVLGMAGGAIWGYLLRYAETEDDPPQVIAISNTKWTGESHGKAGRQIEVAAQFHGQYDPEKDPGMDISDATAMGLWWIRRRNDAALKAAQG